MEPKSTKTDHSATDSAKTERGGNNTVKKRPFDHVSKNEASSENGKDITLKRPRQSEAVTPKVTAPLVQRPVVNATVIPQVNLHQMNGSPNLTKLVLPASCMQMQGKTIILQLPQGMLAQQSPAVPVVMQTPNSIQSPVPTVPNISVPYAATPKPSPPPIVLKSVPPSIRPNTSEKLTVIDDDNAVSCKVCEEPFETSCDREEHVLAHMNYRPFHCVLCDLLFRSEEENRAHLLQKHCDRPYKCEACGYMMPSKEIMSVHLDDHLGDTFYTCEPCGDIVDGLMLDEHVRKHMPDEPYQCLFCPEKGKEREKISEHMKDHLDEDIEPCNYCQKRCSKDQVIPHMALHEWDNPYTCKQCCENYQTKDGLKNHITRKHFTILNGSLCSLCPGKFSNRTSLLEHALKEHSKAHSECQACHQLTEDEISREHVEKHCHRFNRCKYCGLDLDNEKMLYQHLALHRDKGPSEKPKCVACEIDFGTEQELLLHACISLPPVKRTEEQSLFCRFCFEIFTSQQALFEHVATHASVQCYKCRFCNLQLDDREDLLSHVQSHSLKNNTFRCFLCQEIFPGSEELREHVMRHFLEKTNNCPVCKTDLSGDTDFKMHQINHLVKRYYTCVFCLEELAQPSLLNIHISKHNHSKPYICSLCDSELPDLEALQKHVKAHVKVPLTTGGKNQNAIVTSPVVVSQDVTRPLLISRMPSVPEGAILHQNIGNVSVLDSCEVSHNLRESLTKQVIHTAASLPETPPVIRPGRVFPRSLEMDPDDIEQPSKDGNDVVEPTCSSSPKDIHPSSEAEESRALGGVDGMNPCDTEGISEIDTVQCHLCSKTFTMEDFKAHLKTHIDCSEYRCIKCQSEFPSAEDNLKHMVSEHVSEFRIKCKVCHKVIKDELTEDHMAKHLSKEYYRCRPCREVFGSEDLDEHVKSHMEDTVYQCMFCGARGPDKRKMARHMKAHPEKEIKCRICKDLIKKSSIPSHINEHQWENAIQCAICFKKYKNLKEVERHIHKGHLNPLKSIYCGICKERFTTENKLKIHVVTSHSEHGRECSFCDLIIPRGTDIKIHLKEHLTRISKCKKCRKELQLERELFDHLVECLPVVSGKREERTPSEHKNVREKSVKCIMCPTYCKSLEILMKHLKKHVGEAVPRIVKCPRCPRIFRNLQQFIVHCETHLGLNASKASISAVESEKVSAKVTSPNAKDARDVTYVGNNNVHLSSSSSNLHLEEEESKTVQDDIEELQAEIIQSDKNISRKDGISTSDKNTVQINKNTEEIEEIKDLSASKEESPKKKKRHHCTKCEASFDTVADLLQHGNKHLKKIQPALPGAGFKCVMCEESFDSETGLKEHVPSHLTEAPTKCQVCGVQVKGSDLKAHVINHLESTYFTCIICLDLLMTEADLDKHYGTHFITLPTQCKICSAEINDVLSLQLHFKIHVKRDVSQSQPPAKSLGVWNMQQALSSVSPVPMKSILRSKDSSIKGKKPESKITAPSPKGQPLGLPAGNLPKQTIAIIANPPLPIVPHQVELKPKLVPGSSSTSRAVGPKELSFLPREEAQKIHSKCEHCSEEFFSKKALLRHRRSHEASSRTCTVCGRVYRTKKLLHLHARQHDTQRYYFCTVCDKPHISKSYLLTHMVTHGTTERGPLVCDSCFKGFIDKSTFKSHVCGQSGKGPFACSICNKAHISKKFLDDHMKVHYESRRFICLGCDKKFKERKEYETHCRSCKRKDSDATQPRVYQCGICNLFIDGDIVEHMKKHPNIGLSWNSNECSNVGITPDSEVDILKDEKELGKDGDSNEDGVVDNQDDRMEDDTENVIPETVLDSVDQEEVAVGSFTEVIIASDATCESSVTKNSSSQDNSESVAAKCESNTCQEKELIVHSCHICPKLFPSDSSIQAHIKTHDPSSMPDSLQLYMNRKRPNEPVRIYPNSNGKYECDTCGKVVDTKKQIIRHLPIHLPVKKFQCKFCPKNYNTRREVEIHERKHTEERPFKCSICPKAFRGSYNLKLHMETHNTESPFLCQDCGKGFKTRRHLQYHNKKAHVGGWRQKQREKSLCPHCPKTFLSKYSLESHIKYTHSNVPKMPCEVCGKEFKNPKLLKLHALVHEERRFKCDICGLKIRTQGHLNRHMKAHSGEKQFSCEICGKSFLERAQLNHHIRIHTGDRPFKCTLCSKSFRTKHCLKNHMTTHSAERPFKCEICGTGCKSQERLRHHVKRHAKPQEKMACSLCAKWFSSQGSLNIHVREVHEGRREVCGVCGATFRRPLQLEQHMMEVHPDVEFQLRPGRSSLLNAPPGAVKEEVVEATRVIEEESGCETVVFDGTITEPVFECSLCKVLISGDVHQHLIMHQESDLIHGELVIQTVMQ